MHKVVNVGIGLSCKFLPEIIVASHGDGACLFNSMSILMSDRDTYSAIIWHVVCNYICNPIKLPALKMYLPLQYKTVKEYVVTTNMHSYHTWGTEVEIIALAQLSRFDIVVYTQQNNWVHYLSSTIDSTQSDKALYLSNKSGYHFNPILTAE